MAAVEWSVEKAECSGCADHRSKIDELQRVINRSAHQHADGMDLMREMQVRFYTLIAAGLSCTHTVRRFIAMQLCKLANPSVVADGA